MVTAPFFSISATVLFSYCCFVSLFLCCFLDKGFALDRGQSHYHTLHVTFLLPATACSPSTKAGEKSSSLKVVHRHGPCSKLREESKATVTQLLTQDESRVKSIQSRVAFNSARTTLLDTDSATLPAKSGSTLGTGNYIVTVGLGTPKRGLSLIFDTGSDLTWTQCEPCVSYCYSQQEPKFDPSLSKSYKNVSCSSSQCSSLSSATGNSPSCATSTSTCIYGIQYGDQSYSVGYVGTETLTLTSSDVFPNFLFGCGQNNQGLFRGAAGLLGLGRDPLSLVSQTAAKYGKYFSYCLPSQSSTGHLSFGKGGSGPPKAKFTPLKINPQLKSFYFIDIVGIKVGGKVLSISQSVFTNAGGTVIDSGTVITRLPPGAYSALRAEFRQQMSMYPLTGALSILDTCYDFSAYKTVTVPKISFYFSGNVEVPLQSRGILYASSTNQVCLAFAGNSDATDLAIFGNVQQQTLEVIYDVAGGKLGFATGGCS